MLSANFYAIRHDLLLHAEILDHNIFIINIWTVNAVIKTFSEVLSREVSVKVIEYCLIFKDFAINWILFEQLYYIAYILIKKTYFQKLN